MTDEQRAALIAELQRLSDHFAEDVRRTQDDNDRISTMRMNSYCRGLHVAYEDCIRQLKSDEYK